MQIMGIQEPNTVIECIYWSYANLAMAHSAVKNNQSNYERINFIVRAKLFKGLKSGSMNMRTIFDDEKIKLQTGQACNYCGASESLTLDHIFPVKYGGKDLAENLIYACKSCNSSKGKKDLMEWMSLSGKFLPLMIIRRYLKLIYNYCFENNLLENTPDDLKSMRLPFIIEFLPINFPRPNKLVLNIES